MHKYKFVKLPEEVCNSRMKRIRVGVLKKFYNYTFAVLLTSLAF